MAISSGFWNARVVPVSAAAGEAPQWFVLSAGGETFALCDSEASANALAEGLPTLLTAALKLGGVERL